MLVIANGMRERRRSAGLDEVSVGRCHGLDDGNGFDCDNLFGMFQLVFHLVYQMMKKVFGWIRYTWRMMNNVGSCPSTPSFHHGR